MNELVAAYLQVLPEEQRSALESLRADILAAAPSATEVLSYGVPTFKLKKMLVSYGAAKNHCSFYVMSTAVLDAHAAELQAYKLGKGSIQFSPEHPLPKPLVARLVAARLHEIGAA